MKTKTKNTLIRIGVALLVVILSVSCCVFIGRATKGFQNDATVIFQNDDNLVHNLEGYTGTEGQDANGITWTVLTNRKIHAEGENTSTSAKSSFVLGTIKIEETDYYTLAGVEDSDEYYIEMTYSSNGEDVVLSTAEDGEVTSSDKIQKDTVVTLTLYVAIGADVDVTFAPSLVAGKEAGRF